MHVHVAAELHRLEIRGHAVHVQAPVEQGVGQVAIVIIEDEAMVVEQEQDQEAHEKQQQAHRPFPPGPGPLRRGPPAAEPIQAEEGQQEQGDGAHGAEISECLFHFAAPPAASCRLVRCRHCTPRIGPCQRAAEAPVKKAHLS